MDPRPLTLFAVKQAQRAPEHVTKNRRGWNSSSDEYEKTHGSQLSANPLAWGTWSIPESDLQVLGEVRGKAVLELGCGAARWSIGLAGLGAHAIGLDLSDRQLHHARRFVDEAGARVPLAQASAEALPFVDASFDIVFCDHGAMSFADPYKTVPEVARILRRGGLFAFNMSSPIRDVCLDPQKDAITPSLQDDYFELHRMDWEDDDTVGFQLPYGKWIRLFRAHDLVVEDLVELRPPPGATTSYDDYVELEWARRWPAENVWKVRKKR